MSLGCTLMLFTSSLFIIKQACKYNSRGTLQWGDREVQCGENSSCNLKKFILPKIISTCQSFNKKLTSILGYALPMPLLNWSLRSKCCRIIPTPYKP